MNGLPAKFSFCQGVDKSERVEDFCQGISLNAVVTNSVLLMMHFCRQSRRHQIFLHLLLLCNKIRHVFMCSFFANFASHKKTSYYPRSSTETREGYNLTLPFVVFRGTHIYLSYFRRSLTKMQGDYHDTLYSGLQQKVGIQPLYRYEGHFDHFL